MTIHFTMVECFYIVCRKASLNYCVPTADNMWVEELIGSAESLKYLSLFNELCFSFIYFNNTQAKIYQELSSLINIFSTKNAFVNDYTSHIVSAFSVICGVHRFYFIYLFFLWPSYKKFSSTHR